MLVPWNESGALVELVLWSVFHALVQQGKLHGLTEVTDTVSQVSGDAYQPVIGD